jgi:hypothetical protein
MEKDYFNESDLRNPFRWIEDLKSNISLKNNYKSIFGISEMLKSIDNRNAYNKLLGMNSMLGISALKEFQDLTIQKNLAYSLSSPFTSQFEKIFKQQDNLFKSLSPLRALTGSNSFLQVIEQIRMHRIPDISNALSGFVSVPEQNKIFNENIQKYLINTFDIYITEEKSESIVDKIDEDLLEIKEFLVDLAQGHELTNEKLDALNDTLIKSNKTAFLYFVISLIFALLLYNYPKLGKGKKAEIVIDNIQLKEIERGFNRTLEFFCLEKRKAIINVNMRNGPSMNSAKVGLVLKDEIVLVQNINHKWIYIAFQDEDSVLRTGWVYKKYFEKID